MCRYLNTEIYCEGHGYLPIEKPQHELNPADERVLVKRLVLSRRSVLICGRGNCFSYPDLKYEYGKPQYDVYLRFREGRCLPCIYKEAEGMLRGTFSQTYHEVTLEHLPPTGQPLSPHIHDKASMDYRQVADAPPRPVGRLHHRGRHHYFEWHRGREEEG
ncbi:hypothetical protein BJ166DRAFT_498205 [Pestalotiopsis sp. NC0098]|nr:hypothetical protein BJ166DRAFT_498205 [Pestalotiopsis sp. NC0098]